MMVFGTFDRFHRGHTFVLSQASQRGKLTVVVARDHHVRMLKGHAPAEPENARIARVKQEAPHADVRLGDEEDFIAPVKSVRPDVILLGYDQLLPPGITLADLPCPVERLPAFQPELYKSSRLREQG